MLDLEGNLVDLFSHGAAHMSLVKRKCALRGF